MSNEVICKNCQTANPLGSKFCNRCGERLPLSTKILCPHCNTPNPRNHLYCDNCGRRLSEETLPEEPKPEEKQSGREMFNLPARPPGMTGPLDSQQLKEWWNAHKSGEDDQQPIQEFHSLEDISPLKKTTDELPTWLVDKLDSSDPGFEPPREITTDHFLELLKTKGSPEGEESDEIDSATSRADLPDWLQDVAPSTSQLESETGESKPRRDSGLLPSDWLADLSDEDEDEPETIDSWGQEKAASDIPDWLADFRETQSETSSELPIVADKWDDEDEVVPPSGVFDMSEFAEDVFGGTDLPDWLDSEETLEEAEETSQERDGKQVSGLFQSDEFAQEVKDTLGKELPDWLHESDDQQGEDIAPDVVASETAKENLHAWLDELDETDEEEQEEGESPEAGEPDLEEEPSDWLAELGPAYTAELKPNKVESDELPDWLSELGPPQTNILPDSAELVSLPQESGPLSDFLPDIDESVFPDWMEEEEPEPDSEMGEAEETAVTDTTTVTDTDTTEDDSELDELEPDISLAEDPDWLAELSALSPEALTAELTPPDEEEFVEYEEIEAEATAVPPITPPTFSDDTPPSEMPVFTGLLDSEPGTQTEAVEPTEKDYFEDIFDFDEDEVNEEVPEWLTQLGLPPTDSKSEPYESDQLDSDSSLVAGDLPEWIASMRPGPEEHVSSMPGLSASPLAEADFADIPDELIGADLPDWLGDAPAAVSPEQPQPTSEERTLADIPDWLQFKEEEEAKDLFDSNVEDIAGELTALLDALPPAHHPMDDLAKAELPDWIQAMKPRELTAEGPEQPERPLQETGPLSGIRGVIDIEPIIATPHEGNGAFTVPAFTATPAQQEHATLLRQIQANLQEHARAIDTQGVAGTSLLTRTLLAILLLAAILTGLFGPNMQRLPAPSVGVENTYAMLEMAAGKSVIVAFEYTPAMAAELNTQAEVLLAQLAANGSPIITVSQYAAGLALADAHTADMDVTSLGLVPGEAIGLRELGHCLDAGEGCATLVGHTLDTDTRSQLADVGLIIILTGERTSLLNWIEQVGTASKLPLVAGVTQALEPVAAPYAASEQLQGVVAGLADTAVYPQTTANTDTAAQLNAQHLAQLLAAFVLLIGGFVSAFSRKKQA